MVHPQNLLFQWQDPVNIWGNGTAGEHPVLDEEAVDRQCDSRSALRLLGRNVTLPTFGEQTRLSELSTDKSAYAASLGIPRSDGDQRSRLIGHPTDVFASLTEGTQKTIDSPAWEMELFTPPQ